MYIFTPEQPLPDPYPLVICFFFYFFVIFLLTFKVPFL
jgi:hypothetical protein